MTYVIMNPGSGPVEDHSHAEAQKNIEKFVEDIDGINKVIIDDTGKEYKGRYTFILECDGRKSEIEMPGIPLDDVRYLGKNDENILHYPRLYENGSSWVWCYATSQSYSHLFESEEDDESE